MKLLSVLVITLMVSACGPLPVRQGFDHCVRLGRPSECITVPLGSLSDDAEAKRFAPPSNGKGRIYLVRPLTTQPTKKSQVFLDRHRVAEIAPLTYVVLDVDPGTHLLSVHTEDAPELLLDVGQGEIYYVQYGVYLRFNTIAGKLEMREADTARRRIQPSKRAAFNEHNGRHPESAG